MSIYYFLYRFYFLNEILLQGPSDKIYLITLLLVFALVAYLFVKSKKDTAFSISIEEQHHFLRTISEFTSTADIIVDEKNKIRFVNTNFSDLFGGENNEYPGKFLSELSLPKEITTAIAEHNGEEITRTTYKGIKFEIKSSFITDYNGKFIGKFVRIESTEVRGDGTDLSHDLKTPLHAIKGYSNILQKKEKLDKEEQEMFRLISENSELLGDRIDRLLGNDNGNDVSSDKTKLGNTNIEKILVVDDVSINRKLLRMILKQHNFDVYEAHDGETAVRMAEEEKPDIILMDISMPGIDGIEAVKLIRQKGGQFKEIPIIAVTASLLYDKNTLIKKGFNGLLNKPFKEEDLLQMIGSPKEVS